MENVVYLIICATHLLYRAGNKVRRVFTIGENFYDITFRENVPASATSGSAMLNTAVSLARCSIDVTLISEFSADHLGSTGNDFLMSNGVNTESIYRYEGKTPIAMAFLDEMNDAEYVLYETYPYERLKIVNPVLKKGDIILFGSLMAVSEQVRKKLSDILKSAGEHITGTCGKGFLICI
jgi:fructokinase